MSGGLVHRIRVWRIVADEDNDDSVGGAQLTGSAVYCDMPARIQMNMPSQLLLQQGLETVKTFTCLCRPGKHHIYEGDKIEVTAPHDHPYHGQRLRVRGVLEQNFHPDDGRGYLLLTLTHDEVAHANQ